MESLLAEEMAVSSVAVERIARTGVVAVRAHVGGHFDQNEMRSSPPPPRPPTKRPDPATCTSLNPTNERPNGPANVENRLAETTRRVSGRDAERPALTRAHNHAVRPSLSCY